MTVDVSTIRELLDWSDPAGVVSLYVEHVPQQAASAPTAPLEIRNRTKDLLSSMDAGLTGKVRERLDAASDDLAWLTDPATHGRGRALFLGVSDGRAERVAVQVPFRPRVIHHAHPFVRPLVAAVDEGRPALVVLVDAKSVQTLRWAVGELEHLDTREFEVGDAQLADEHQGPSGKPERRAVAHQEQFDNRMGANRARFLKSVGEDVRDRLKDDGIDRLLVCGPARVRADLLDAIPEHAATQVIESDQVLGDVGDARLMDVCWERLRSAHRERERELVGIARDRAGAGGAGVLGVAGTLAALNEGRVSHLLFADDLVLPGFVGDDGLLYRTPGSDHDRRPTALLVEHMVERALDTGAQVTPIDDTVAAELGDDGGVAALLRW